MAGLKSNVTIPTNRGVLVDSFQKVSEDAMQPRTLPSRSLDLDSMYDRIPLPSATRITWH